MQGFKKMINKRFILNADDFGLTKYHNQAVLEGYVNGFLTSASLCVNTDAFEGAVNNILPDCPNLSVGVHLNIVEGKALTGCSKLTDSDGYFNKGYLYLLINQKKSEILKDIELEFRSQIEKAKACCSITHIDSHVHIHSIPSIFELVCKLAKEYEIPYVRTQFEELYFVPFVSKHINLKYPINLIKVFLLQYLTGINRQTVDKYGLKTNDFIVGVGYTGMMDNFTVEYGLNVINEESLTEALIHPCKYDGTKKDSHTREFGITQNQHLIEKIKSLGFEITNFNN